MNWFSPGSPFRLTNHFLSASQGLSTSKVLKSHCNCPESFLKKCLQRLQLIGAAWARGVLRAPQAPLMCSHVCAQHSTAAAPVCVLFPEHTQLLTHPCSLTCAFFISFSAPLPPGKLLILRHSIRRSSARISQVSHLEMADHLIYPFNRANRDHVIYDPNQHTVECKREHY